MSRSFLDTNVFLRHLLNDDPVQSPAALTLFRAIEQGTISVWTSDLVVAELVFVLSNKRTYHVPREALRDMLLPLLDLPGIKLAGKRLYHRVFALYVSEPIDYIDAYHATLVEQQQGRALYSFDTDFDRIPEIARTAPETPSERASDTTP